jgi:pimeloyl-ACP methyl ester carboxylesterase
MPDPVPENPASAPAGRPRPTLARRAVRVLLLAAAAYALFLIVLCSVQRRLVYFPEPLPENAPIALPQGMSEVWIPARDGARVHGLFRPPPPGGPVVLFLHGNAGNAVRWLSFFEEILRPRAGGLMIDYRGFGKSPGRPAEQGLYADAQGALDWLEGKGFPPSRVVLFGKSLGTGVAVELARTRGAAGLVLESPYTSLPDVGRRRFPMVPVRLLMRDRFDSLSKAAEIRCPVLGIWGGLDATVPPDLSERLFAALPGPKESFIVPAAGHMDIQDVAPGEYRSRWSAFLAKATPGGPGREGGAE